MVYQTLVVTLKTMYEVQYFLGGVVDYAYVHNLCLFHIKCIYMHAH